MTGSDSNVDFHSCSVVYFHSIIGNLQNENTAVAPVLTYAQKTLKYNYMERDTFS